MSDRSIARKGRSKTSSSASFYREMDLYRTPHAWNKYPPHGSCRRFPDGVSEHVPEPSLSGRVTVLMHQWLAALRTVSFFRNRSAQQGHSPSTSEGVIGVPLERSISVRKRAPAKCLVRSSSRGRTSAAKDCFEDRGGGSLVLPS